MAIVFPTVGQIFEPTNVAQNIGVTNPTYYGSSFDGVYNFPDPGLDGPGLGISDADIGGKLNDYQLVTAISLTPPDPYSIGSITLQDTTQTGIVQSTIKFDILGSQNNADGSSYLLLGGVNLQGTLDVTNGQPQFNGFYMLSTKDISNLDNDYPTFPINFTTNGAPPLTLDAVARDLDGTTLDGSNDTSYLINVRKQGITANSDGSFTIAAGDQTTAAPPGGHPAIKYLGTLPLAAGSPLGASAGPFISITYGGNTYVALVIAFDQTNVLVYGYSAAGTNSSGQTVYSQNAIKFIIGSSGGNDQYLLPGAPDSKSLTLYTTGASYTNPNGTSFPCFGRGTRIATPTGARRVEELRAGDLVLTASGETRPVVWVGDRRVHVGLHPRPENVRPVVIRAGAFAENVPARDLVLSPDHNVFVEGVLIPAKCLVNGRNVVISDMAVVDYHHVELETHDVLLAEDLAAESYLDTGNRASFAGGPTVDAFPDFASAPDLNYFAWEAKGCARLVLAGPELDKARALLAERADADVADAAIAA